jgi:hypothetical protein
MSPPSAENGTRIGSAAAEIGAVTATEPRALVAGFYPDSVTRRVIHDDTVLGLTISALQPASGAGACPARGTYPAVRGLL